MGGRSFGVARYGARSFLRALPLVLGVITDRVVDLGDLLSIFVTGTAPVARQLSGTVSRDANRSLGRGAQAGGKLLS